MVYANSDGHDRSPVFLLEEDIQKWLHPEGKSVEHLDVMLSHSNKVKLAHMIADAV